MGISSLNRSLIRAVIPFVALLSLMLVGCGDDGGNDGSADTPSATTTSAPESATASTGSPSATVTADATEPTETLSGTVSVFAAASLTDVFEDIAEAFEAEHPGLALEFNFAGSSALATQIEEGAPADVFASANLEQMRRVADAELIEGEAQVFVRNLPVLVVPADNPGEVTTPADLAMPGLRLVLALEDVPIGRYAREIIANLGADPAYGAEYEAAALANVVSSEEDVRAVLAKVELGEADAGVVYKTDAAVSGDRIIVIEFPADANVIAEYPIAVTAEAANPDAAQAFIDFVLGETGQAALAAAGFDSAP